MSLKTGYVAYLSQSHVHKSSHKMGIYSWSSNVSLTQPCPAFLGNHTTSENASTFSKNKSAAERHREVKKYCKSCYE